MKTSSTFFLLPAFVALVLVGGCANGANDEYSAIDFTPEAPRTLLTTLGSDTMSVEIYTRAGDTISGTVVDRNPFTYITSFTATLAADGTIQSLNAERSKPDASGVRNVGLAWSVSIADGEATIVREGGDNPGSVTMEAPLGTIPTLGRTPAAGYVFEEINRHFRNAASPDAEVWLVSPTSAAPQRNRSAIVSADSISMDFFGSPRYGWFGNENQLMGESGAKTTMKSETRRSAPLDIEPLISRWVALDEAGNGIGAPSPKAEVSATVDDAHLEIVYSRPAKRGREIWGGLVPYNEVWRTGANSATMFTTSEDLMFGETLIPAGSYTVWTTFTPDSQTLIFNSQIGQWGTAHDDALDFARVPMTKSAVPVFTERFTISVADEADGAVLNLDWDDTRFSAKFRKK